MKTCPYCTTGFHDSHTTCPTHGVVLNEIRDLKPGMEIRRTYRIVRKVGKGGMGTVYQADHMLMKEPRALKFLSSDFSSDAAFTSRFLREVQSLRQVHSKNVVVCGDLEPAEDDSLFFSMEYVDGPDLRDFLDKAPKPFDVKQALEIARGIAEGLGAAHAAGIVHRDIKPENILMAHDGDRWVPKIADFGIVATKENSRAHTRTGGTLLTMSYAAPEQWRGMRAAELDGRTDIYALGGVLFEMLTGQSVFNAESYEGWAEQHRNVAPRAPSQLRPELANWEDLDDLVLWMLAKDRDQRPRDIQDVLRAIDAVRYVASSARRPTKIEDAPQRRKTNREIPNAQQDRVPNSRQKKASRIWRPLFWILPSAILLTALIAAGIATWTLRSGAPAKTAGGAIQHNLPAPQKAPMKNEPTQIAKVKPDKHTQGSSEPLKSAPAESEKRPSLVPKSSVEMPSASVKNPSSVAPRLDETPLNVPGIFADPETGLSWTATDNGSDLSFDQAGQYCAGLHLGGHYDWKLPQIEQLRGLYDGSGQGLPACKDIDGSSLSYPIRIRKGIRLSCYTVWSSSVGHSVLMPNGPEPTIKSFDYYNGGIYDKYKNEKNQIRSLCVRGS